MARLAPYPIGTEPWWHPLIETVRRLFWRSIIIAPDQPISTGCPVRSISSHPPGRYSPTHPQRGHQRQNHHPNGSLYKHPKNSGKQPPYVTSLSTAHNTFYIKSVPKTTFHSGCSSITEFRMIDRLNIILLLLLPHLRLISSTKNLPQFPSKASDSPEEARIPLYTVCIIHLLCILSLDTHKCV